MARPSAARRSRWTWPSPGAQLVLVDLDVVAAREEAVEDSGEVVEVAVIAETAEVMEDLAASSEAADVVAASLEEVPGEAAEVTAEVVEVEREAREEAVAEARAMELPSRPPTRGHPQWHSYNILGLTHPSLSVGCKHISDNLDKLIFKKWVH